MEDLHAAFRTARSRGDSSRGPVVLRVRVDELPSSEAAEAAEALAQEPCF